MVTIFHHGMTAIEQITLAATSFQQIVQFVLIIYERCLLNRTWCFINGQSIILFIVIIRSIANKLLLELGLEK